MVNMAQLATMAKVKTLRNSRVLDQSNLPIISQSVETLTGKPERARTGAMPKLIPYQPADRLNAPRIV